MTRSRAATRFSDEVVYSLLTPHEVVRDPVHGDIWLTALERALIDTPAFQRLRFIQQLGPTQVVYPGATHTRFLHSLGTLHTAQQLVETVNRNFAIYSQADAGLILVEPYPRLIIRLFALLHDVAHIPFGHTLEDEGNLAPPEWDDQHRARELLGNDPTLSVVPATRAFLQACRLPREASKTLITDLTTYLCHTGDPFVLEFPFIADLIGNTLCADLLDYVDRDSYFCGLRERSGDRVVKHVAVLRLEPHAHNSVTHSEYVVSDDAGRGKGRVVLLTYRFERDHLAGAQYKVVRKPEILSEAVDLLRRRFSLAQKVYFHRTKLAASAMLISATANSGLETSDLYGLTDSNFLHALVADPDPCCARLASAYLTRRLYRPVYMVRHKPKSDEEWRSVKLWESYDQFRDPRWREEQARWLEQMSGLPAGSCSIYCPDREMNLKEFDMLVQSRSGGTVRPLKDTLDDTRQKEMDAINNRFAELWGLHVFVDPAALDVWNVDDPRVQDLGALCEGLFGFENDIEQLAGKGTKSEKQIVAVARKELERDGFHIAAREVREAFAEVKGDGTAEVFRDLVQSLRIAKGAETSEPGVDRRARDADQTEREDSSDVLLGDG